MSDLTTTVDAHPAIEIQSAANGLGRHQAGGGVRRALLVIADIGGYTPFMKAHRTSLAHAQDVVARLLEAALDAAPDLTLLEIEGDAAFFYVWPESAGLEEAEWVIERVVAMHRAFHACQGEIGALNTCRCEGCRQVGQLRIKFVAHAGEVAVQRVKRSAKLAGLDVILVHRMLKNAVPVPEYLLLSEALFRSSREPGRGRLLHQDLEGFGPMPTYFVDLAEIAATPPPLPAVTLGAQLRENLGVIYRSLPYLLGVRRLRFASSGRRGP